MTPTIHSLKASFFSLALSFFFYSTSFATTDTVSTYSAAMEKQIKAVVVTPADYSKSTKYPVVYMLHGYSGDYSDFVKKVPQIQEYADRFGMILVSADGNFGSWYWDSPVEKSSKYETYVSSELVSFIDKNYSTIAESSARAITGLSMGGHGAMYLAIRHPETFGAVGSMSGGVDILPFPENWEMKKYLGTKAENPQRWEEYSVMGQVNKLIAKRQAIIITCGTDDFFYQVNLKLHDKLTYNNIPHTFISNPGGHTWEYWNDAIPYQLQFFHVFFEK